MEQASPQRVQAWLGGSSLGAAHHARRLRMPDCGPPDPRQVQGRGRGRLSHVGGSLVLRVHRLADRWDLIPPQFGAAAPVDADDAQAVLAEWVRCLRDWADYNSEQVFALKVGGAMLLAGVLLFWLAIAVLL